MTQPTSNHSVYFNLHLTQPIGNNSACIDFQEYVEDACNKVSPTLNIAAQLIAYPAIVYAGTNIANGIAEGGICIKDVINHIRCKKKKLSESYEMIDHEDFEIKTQKSLSVPLWKRGITSIKNISKGTATLAICYIALEAIGSLATPVDDSGQGQGGCYHSGLRAMKLCNIANDFLVEVILQLFSHNQ